MSSSIVDISGLDKAVLLKALWDGSKEQGMSFLARQPFELEDAQKLYESSQSKFFDYVAGRVIKCDLSDDQMHTWGYDRDNGSGAAEKIVAELREVEKSVTESHDAEKSVTESHDAEKSVTESHDAKKIVTRSHGANGPYSVITDDSIYLFPSSEFPGLKKPLDSVDDFTSVPIIKPYNGDIMAKNVDKFAAQRYLLTASKKNPEQGLVAVEDVGLPHDLSALASDTYKSKYEELKAKAGDQSKDESKDESDDYGPNK